MSVETYRQAHADVMKDLTTRRFDGLPRWAQARISRCVDLLDDAYQALAAAETDADAPDYTMRDADGRYDGDLAAILDCFPGEKKPYRVKVYSWRVFNSRGHEQGYEDGWRDAYDGIDGFDHVKTFKRVWDAVEYVGKVRGRADGKIIVDRAAAAREAGSTRVA